MKNPKRNIRKRRLQRRDEDRRGAAMVEFAVCLPLLVFVTLAFIDLTNLIYFRQAIKISAYDAARKAAEPTATASDVQEAAQRMMSLRGIDNYQLNLPDNYATIDRGSRIDLEVVVPLSEMTSFSGMNLWQDSLSNGITVDISVIKE
jgi:Flp pilus assembly pilin Flp